MTNDIDPTLQPLRDSPSEPNEPAGENRIRSDRRLRPTSVWDAFPPAGRRMRNRRAAEHRTPYFVDRFSATMLTVVLMLALATLVDGVLTIRLIAAGGSEVNPLMSRLIDLGVTHFLLGKYILTVVGLPLLVIFKNHYLFGGRLRVGYLIPALLALYAFLICYQIGLIVSYSVPAV